MIVEEVHLIHIEQAAVGLGQEAWFKGPHALAEGFFNINRSAESIFCGAEGKVHHRHLPRFCGHAFVADQPFAHLAALQVWVCSGAVVGVSSHDINVGEKVRQRTDRGGFSRPTVAHDHHAADAWVDHVEEKRQLHLLLTDHRSKRENPALPWCRHSDLFSRENCFTGCTVSTWGGVASAG